MKMKSLLFVTLATLGLIASTTAQNLPNYVPANGLVGWWPFNGNANDESGNGNNGTVNGATLTSDRFGESNKAFFFSGINCETRIDAEVNTNSINNSNEYTISVWVIKNGEGCSVEPRILEFYSTSNGALQFNWDVANGVQNSLLVETINNSGLYQGTSFVYENWSNNWNNIVFSAKNGEANLYLNGNLINTFEFQGFPSLTSNVSFGRMNHPAYNTMNGSLDDIALWDRVLTQPEISNLYNALNCANNTAIAPQTNFLATGSTATFAASTTDANPSYVWQSDFGQGYVTLNNYGNYSGVNTNSLSISNVQLSEHNQPIRVISTSGECIDTSYVSTINITDTCIVTINDTITTLISVTDTLVINILITGLTPPNNSNTIKVFPNPANSHITIDFGNFTSMNGYILKITNSIGQIVFTTPVNQQSSYVDLSTWGGNGIYFVQIIDTQNNTIENRKIVLQ